MYDFQFLKAQSVEQAVQMLQSIENAKIIAGGMTLIPTMKQRLASPSALIDLSSITSLTQIQHQGQFIEIGSLCSHDQVAHSSVILQHLPALAQLAGLIADPQVRYKGTIGGSVVNNDPSADYPAALLGLNATVQTSRREIKADDFFLGMFSTDLAADEIVLSIRFPVSKSSSYQKFRHPSTGYALCGVWISRGEQACRVAVGGVFPSARRWRQAEAKLQKSFTPEVLLDAPIELDDILVSHDSSPHYKAQLMRVLSQRAVKELNPHD